MPSEHCDNCGEHYDDCVCWTCPSCEYEYSNSSTYCGECNYCEGCCNCDQEEKHMLDYSTNVLEFLKYKPSHQPHMRYYGVELELNAKNSRDDALERLTNEWSHDRWYVFKEDGSLSYASGFELVTSPMLLSEHYKRWPTIQDLLRRESRGWGISEYGVHIHVTRNTIGPCLLGKLLVFMNSPSNKPRIVRLVGRESYDNARYKNKKLSDGKRSRRDGNRYEAVNTTKETTIEFRVFQSTTKVERIFMYLEFVDSVLNHLDTVPLADAADWDIYHKYILNHRKMYKHLYKYLTNGQPEPDE